MFTFTFPTIEPLIEQCQQLVDDGRYYRAWLFSWDTLSDALPKASTFIPNPRKFIPSHLRNDTLRENHYAEADRISRAIPWGADAALSLAEVATRAQSHPDDVGLWLLHTITEQRYQRYDDDFPPIRRGTIRYTEDKRVYRQPSPTQTVTRTYSKDDLLRVLAPDIVNAVLPDLHTIFDEHRAQETADHDAAFPQYVGASPTVYED